MKQAIIFMILIAIAANSFSQQTNPSQVLTKDDYLAKSRSQKTVAWISLGVGVIMFASAAPGNIDFETLGIVVVIGGIATLASIPLFIAAGRNKRKAMSASANFKMETVPVIQHTILSRKSYPTLSLNTSL